MRDDFVKIFSQEERKADRTQSGVRFVPNTIKHSLDQENLLWGRSRRGTRSRMSMPHSHWKTTTSIGGLRMLGMTAPMMLDGTMTDEWFAASTRR
jgi:hypothetical protein